MEGGVGRRFKRQDVGARARNSGIGDFARSREGAKEARAQAVGKRGALLPTLWVGESVGSSRTCGFARGIQGFGGISREAAKARRGQVYETFAGVRTLICAGHLVGEAADVRLIQTRITMNPSGEPCRLQADPEKVASTIVSCAYRLHVEAGPGLFETVYEPVLAQMLRDAGLRVRCQQLVPVELLGYRFDRGFRADLIVEDVVLVELKSVEVLAPVHAKQVITYLRLLNLPLGLLLNFGAPTFKEGAKRFVNRHSQTQGSPLRINSGG